MHLILDTTSLFHDKIISGANIRTIAMAASSMGWSVWIPEVVLAELTAQCQQEIHDIHRNLTANIIDLLALNNIKRNSKEINLNNKEHYVNKSIESRNANIADVGINIIKYPNIDAKILIDRYYSGLKPYKKDGTGFKDHIIILSLIDHIKKNMAIVVILFS